MTIPIPGLILEIVKKRKSAEAAAKGLSLAVRDTRLWNI
jgi:hypothetical protein